MDLRKRNARWYRGIFSVLLLFTSGHAADPMEVDHDENAGPLQPPPPPVQNRPRVDLGIPDCVALGCADGISPCPRDCYCFGNGRPRPLDWCDTDVCEPFYCCADVACAIYQHDGPILPCSPESITRADFQNLPGHRECFPDIPPRPPRLVRQVADGHLPMPILNRQANELPPGIQD